MQRAKEMQKQPSSECGRFIFDRSEKSVQQKKNNLFSINATHLKMDIYFIFEIIM